MRGRLDGAVREGSGDLGLAGEFASCGEATA
jgi:hypothetical protein